MFGFLPEINAEVVYMGTPEDSNVASQEGKPILMLPPAEEQGKSTSKFIAFVSWLAGKPINKKADGAEVMEHKHWLSFYWAFFKELGNECYRTWRGEVLFSVVLLGFIYLI